MATMRVWGPVVVLAGKFATFPRLAGRQAAMQHVRESSRDGGSMTAGVVRHDSLPSGLAAG